MLPSSFDNWKCRESEVMYAPEGADLENYSCVNCGGDFTQIDLSSHNYNCEFDDDINNWKVTHSDCERGMLP